MGAALKYCRNPLCREPLTSATWSWESAGFCALCGQRVWALNPNPEVCEDWWFLQVADEGSVRSGLAARITGQCVCGGSEFQVVGPGSAVCVGWSGDDPQPGCDRVVPVRLKLGWEVIWPDGSDRCVVT